MAPAREVDVDALVEALRAGDRTALGRAITLVESTLPGHRRQAAELVERLKASWTRTSDLFRAWDRDGDGKIVWELKPGKAFGGIRLPDGNTLIATGDGEHFDRGMVVWESAWTRGMGRQLDEPAGEAR